MQPLSASALLDVWERGRSFSLVERGLLLLEAACPEESPDLLAALPVGRRDARLLILRRWTFGASVEGVADCPRCGERLELAFDVDDVLVPESLRREDAVSPVLIEVEGRELRVRLPDSRDLLAVVERSPSDDARRLLLERCLVDGKTGEGPVEITPALATSVAAALEEADPQAGIQLASTCPACGHEWNTLFDILAWFWSEVEGWGARMLGQVHTLARAYGWSESEILALSARRRDAYLEMTGR